MIKVCHMSSTHPPEDVRVFQKECVSLAKAGYDVSLVVQGESYEKNGVHIVGIGASPGSRIDRMLNTSRKVYKASLEIDADIYHFHDPELLPYGLKLKKQGKRVVFDSHENYSEQLKNKPYLPSWCSKIVASLYSLYEKHALKELDAIIFPCLVKGKNPFEGLCERVVFIDNVPLLEELYDHYDETVPKIENSICHIGSLSYNRGITHLIKAAKQANCVTYIGGGFSTSDYEEEVKAMPEFAVVNYLGELNRQQVLDTLQRCCVGTATLLNVGQYCQAGNLPTKIYEYMAMALPVIMSDTPRNREVAEKYQIGICVDPENTDQIAKAIRYLLDNPEEAKRMGENGRRTVKEEFNWRNEEEKLLSLYEDIMKN